MLGTAFAYSWLVGLVGVRYGNEVIRRLFYLHTISYHARGTSSRGV